MRNKNKYKRRKACIPTSYFFFLLLCTPIINTIPSPYSDIYPKYILSSALNLSKTNTPTHKHNQNRRCISPSFLHYKHAALTKPIYQPKLQLKRVNLFHYSSLHSKHLSHSLNLHIKRRKQINLMTRRNLGNLSVLPPQQLPHILQQFRILLMRTRTQRLNKRPRQSPTKIAINMSICRGLIISTPSKLDNICLTLIVLLSPSTGRLVILGTHEEFPHRFQPREKSGRFVARQKGEPDVGEAAHDLKEGGGEGGKEGNE